MPIESVENRNTYLGKLTQRANIHVNVKQIKK